MQGEIHYFIQRLWVAEVPEMDNMNNVLLA
jgi:hypothetical protein